MKHPDINNWQDGNAKYYYENDWELIAFTNILEAEMLCQSI